MATLYRKYRSQTFADLIGQDHVRQTIQSALLKGRLSHAYLFAGPRGVGKTSTARLIAKAVNCLRASESPDGVAETEPCNECQLCLEITDGRQLDVLEIDAASNRGIDEIRELRERIRFAPTQARKKIFIIDEVHMLTKEAFNALLKTLEEPPAHVMFMLATTELHKVPPTITSRCQVFVFQKAREADLVGLLTRVTREEGKDITPEAAGFLATLAKGSFRDSLSILDQVLGSAPETLSKETVLEVLGLSTEEQLFELTTALVTRDAKRALAVLAELETSGIDIYHLGDQLIGAARRLLYLHLGIEGASAVRDAEPAVDWQGLALRTDQDTIAQLLAGLIEAKAEMRYAVHPLLPFEILCVQFGAGGPSSEERKPGPKPKRATAKAAKPAPAADAPIEAVSHETVEVPVLEAIQSVDNDQAWSALLADLKVKNAGLFALLGQAKLRGIRGNQLDLEVPYQFVADRVKDHKYHTLLGELMKTHFGYELICRCEVKADRSRRPVRAIQSDDEPGFDPGLVDFAAEVFGIDKQAD